MAQPGLDEGTTGPTSSEARSRWLAGAPVNERRLTVAGVSTALLEGGQGDPVVLLHGQGGFGGMFLPLLDDLTSTHRVVVPDLPGLGASTVAGGRLDSRRVMRWLDELLERTCPTPPTLVGHSLGGSIAARYAAAHPRRLARLVLVDTGGLAGRVRPAPSVLLALIRFAIRPTVRNADRFSRRIMFDRDRTYQRMGPGRRELFRAYMIELARTPSVKHANRALLRELGFPAIPVDELSRVDVPTTLIWGRHDPVMSLAGAEQASRRHGWPLEVIEEAGHVPAVEQPAAFLAALRRAMDA
ncbi:MAG TPA: alpha/beta hydrolase [Nitriliruptorales bacterium]|nr:alpha/beta hydrolase [Nitriliruptorales bacterium]